MYENAYRDKLVDRQPKIIHLAKKLDKAMEKGSKNNSIYMCLDASFIYGESLGTTSTFVNSGLCLYKYYRSFLFGISAMPVRVYATKNFKKMGYSTMSLIFGFNKRVPTNNKYIKDICFAVGLKPGRRFYQERTTQEVDHEKSIQYYIECFTYVATTIKAMSINLRILCGVNYDPLIHNVDSKLSSVKPYIQLGIEL